MKKILVLHLLLLLITFGFSQNKKYCDFDLKYQESNKNANYVQLQTELQRAIKSFPLDKMDTVIVIPTAVHIVYKNQTENISKEQINTQIEVLNRDFRKLNSDTTNANGFSVADVKFEFQLALRDPNGNPSSGITRTFTNRDNIGASDDLFVIRPAWNSRVYMNIWVADVGDGVLGSASSPNMPGISEDEDGILIGTPYFGTIGTAQFPFNLGRTTTHEVGHFFNLLHIWGAQESCNSDDLVADTPNQENEIYFCPANSSSCGSTDNISNFLGYVDDRCMGNFTEGQKARMRTALYVSRDSLQFGAKLGLVGLTENNPLNKISFYPNPTSGEINLDLPQEILLKDLEIGVYSISGKAVNFETIPQNGGLQLQLKATPGFYFVRFANGKFSSTKKIIKQ